MLVDLDLLRRCCPRGVSAWPALPGQRRAGPDAKLTGHLDHPVVMQSEASPVTLGSYLPSSGLL